MDREQVPGWVRSYMCRKRAGLAHVPVGWRTKHTWCLYCEQPVVVRIKRGAVVAVYVQTRYVIDGF